MADPDRMRVCLTLKRSDNPAHSCRPGPKFGVDRELLPDMICSTYIHTLNQAT